MSHVPRMRTETIIRFGMLNLIQRDWGSRLAGYYWLAHSETEHGQTED